jgi:hypothetical protein
MNYRKQELKKSVARSARTFTFDMKHMPSAESLVAFEDGLRHWPDYIGLLNTGTAIQVILADRPNKLGRLTTDDEAAARLVDLGCKLLVPGGEEEE